MLISEWKLQEKIFFFFKCLYNRVYVLSAHAAGHVRNRGSNVFIFIAKHLYIYIWHNNTVAYSRGIPVVIPVKKKKCIFRLLIVIFFYWKETKTKLTNGSTIFLHLQEEIVEEFAMKKSVYHSPNIVKKIYDTFVGFFNVFDWPRVAEIYCLRIFNITKYYRWF